MTCAAIFRGLYPALFFDLRRESELILARLPSRIGDLFARAEVEIGVTVAFETPAHRERRPLIDAVHFLDRAVALRAVEIVAQVRPVAELDELAAGQALRPKVAVHDLAPWQHGRRLRAGDVDVVRLNVARPPGEEPHAQRFRAPDLVWSLTGKSGFIVLLCSENGGRARTYRHHRLQRFSRSGEPVGGSIDLNRLAPPHLRGSNWEGLDWFVPSESLIVVCERSPLGPGAAMIVDLPEDWRR